MQQHVMSLSYTLSFEELPCMVLTGKRKRNQ